jgi:hypothetical protein
VEDDVLGEKSSSLPIDLRVEVAALAVLHHDVKRPESKDLLTYPICLFALGYVDNIMLSHTWVEFFGV